MELRELRCFVAACELQSVSAAARRVGRVQPAVSNALGRLETELGVNLLRRHSSGVEPTAAGLAFLRHAQTILGAVDRAAGEMAALRDGDPDTGGPCGEVRLGIAAPAAPAVLAGTLRQLAYVAPRVEVPVVEREPEDVLNALVTGQLDLALLWLPVRRNGLEVQALQALPLQLVGAPDVLRAAGAEPEGEAGAPALAALAEQPWITFPAGTVARLWLDGACLRAGVAPRVGREVRTWAECRAALEAGLGASLLPAVVAEPEIASGALGAADVAGAGHAILGVVRRTASRGTAAEEAVHAALEGAAVSAASGEGAEATRVAAHA